MRMRHGVTLPPMGELGDPRVLVELAVQAEAAGWDGFFLWDHVLHDPPLPLADPWVVLGAIAASTSKVRLGPLVTPLARRRPSKVARESVTLDHLSGGRLVLGVGLGTDFWHEFSAFGGEATDDLERAELTDDSIEIITRLWIGEPVTYQGRRLSIDGAHFLPRPLQQPRIPLWSAMIWRPWTRGPVRRAVRCDGVLPFKPEPFTPEEAAEVHALVASERAAAGAEPAFDLALWGLHARAADYEAAGVTWLLDATFSPDTSLADARATIAAGPP